MKRIMALGSWRGPASAETQVHLVQDRPHKVQACTSIFQAGGNSSVENITQLQR